MELEPVGLMGRANFKTTRIWAWCYFTDKLKNKAPRPTKMWSIGACVWTQDELIEKTSSAHLVGWWISQTLGKIFIFYQFYSWKKARILQKKIFLLSSTSAFTLLQRQLTDERVNIASELMRVRALLGQIRKVNQPAQLRTITGKSASRLIETVVFLAVVERVFCYHSFVLFLLLQVSFE